MLSRKKRCIIANTNAIINLDKIYNPGIIRCVNLSGTKLIGNLIKSYDSCLSNCGLTKENLKYYQEGELTDFTLNNLTGVLITNLKQLYLESVARFNEFANTGVNLREDVANSFLKSIEEYDRVCNSGIKMQVLVVLMLINFTWVKLELIIMDYVNLVYIIN